MSIKPLISALLVIACAVAIRLHNSEPRWYEEQVTQEWLAGLTWEQLEQEYYKCKK